MVDGIPSFQHVEAYDGMEILFHMLKATGGKRDADKMMAAAKGYTWNSPRGPVEVDPNTRELIQNVYIRKVEKVNGKPTNVVIKDLRRAARLLAHAAYRPEGQITGAFRTKRGRRGGRAFLSPAGLEPGHPVPIPRPSLYG